MKRTTLILDPQAFRRLKQVAAAEGRTLTALVNEFIRLGLEARRTAKPARRKNLPVYSMGIPKVDLADRDSLYSLMEERD